MRMTFSNRIVWWIFNLLAGLFIGSASQSSAVDMKIAFTSDRDGNSEIYVMDADGSNPVNLTKNQARRDTGPSWQPLPLAVSPQEKAITLWGTLKDKQ